MHTGPAINIEDPKFRKPFKYGWKREVVKRMTGGSVKRFDIYYYYEKAKSKMRTRNEVENTLKEFKKYNGELSIDNFTFHLSPLGINDERYEIVRNAHVRNKEASDKINSNLDMTSKENHRTEKINRNEKVNVNCESVNRNTNERSEVSKEKIFKESKNKEKTESITDRISREKKTNYKNTSNLIHYSDPPAIPGPSTSTFHLHTKNYSKIKYRNHFNTIARPDLFTSPKRGKRGRKKKEFYVESVKLNKNGMPPRKRGRPPKKKVQEQENVVPKNEGHSTANNNEPHYGTRSKLQFDNDSSVNINNKTVNNVSNTNTLEIVKEHNNAEKETIVETLENSTHNHNKTETRNEINSELDTDINETHKIIDPEKNKTVKPENAALNADKNNHGGKEISGPKNILCDYKRLNSEGDNKFKISQQIIKRCKSHLLKFKKNPINFLSSNTALAKTASETETDSEFLTNRRKYLKPLNQGWQRILVKRNHCKDLEIIKVYYSYKGEKTCKNISQIEKSILGTDLTADNFTFKKKPLGLTDPHKELIRRSNIAEMRRAQNALFEEKGELGSGQIRKKRRPKTNILRKSRINQVIDSMKVSSNAYCESSTDRSNESQERENFKENGVFKYDQSATLDEALAAASDHFSDLIDSDSVPTFSVKENESKNSIEIQNNCLGNGLQVSNNESDSGMEICERNIQRKDNSEIMRAKSTAQRQSDLSDTNFEITARRPRSPLGRKIEVSYEKLTKPFEYGWKRVQVRKSEDPDDTMYTYYCLNEKAYRTLGEIAKELQGTDLTTENFSFSKKAIGVNDEEKELIRFSGADPKSGKRKLKTPTPQENTVRWSGFERKTPLVDEDNNDNCVYQLRSKTPDITGRISRLGIKTSTNYLTKAPLESHNGSIDMDLLNSALESVSSSFAMDTTMPNILYNSCNENGVNSCSTNGLLNKTTENVSATKQSPNQKKTGNFNASNSEKVKALRDIYGDLISDKTYTSEDEINKEIAHIMGATEIETENFDQDKEITQTQDIKQAKKSIDSYNCLNSLTRRESCLVKPDSPDSTQPDINNVKKIKNYELPFEYGWKRVLIEKVNSNGTEYISYVVYKAPDGKIYRTIRDIGNAVYGTKLSVDNFTLSKKLVHPREENKEIIMANCSELRGKGGEENLERSDENEDELTENEEIMNSHVTALDSLPLEILNKTEDPSLEKNNKLSNKENIASSNMSLIVLKDHNYINLKNPSRSLGKRLRNSNQDITNDSDIPSKKPYIRPDESPQQKSKNMHDTEIDLSTDKFTFSEKEMDINDLKKEVYKILPANTNVLPNHLNEVSSNGPCNITNSKKQVVQQETRAKVLTISNHYSTKNSNSSKLMQQRKIKSLLKQFGKQQQTPLVIDLSDDESDHEKEANVTNNEEFQKGNGTREESNISNAQKSPLKLSTVESIHEICEDVQILEEPKSNTTSPHKERHRSNSTTPKKKEAQQDSSLNNKVNNGNVTPIKADKHPHSSNTPTKDKYAEPKLFFPRDISSKTGAMLEVVSSSSAKRTKTIESGNLSPFSSNSFVYASASSFNIFKTVFSYLSLHDLLQMSRVCQMWKFIANQPFLWKHVCLKNINIKDWSAFSDILKKNNTQYLDLREMYISEDECNDLWIEFLNEMPKVFSLKKIALCKCSPFVIDRVINSFPELEVLILTDCKLSVVSEVTTDGDAAFKEITLDLKNNSVEAKFKIVD